MSFIGIDLGADTTTAFSPEGEYIEDSFNKKVIPSLFDKTIPRQFGNHVRRDNRKGILKRVSDIFQDPKDLRMFIGYLEKLINIKYSGNSISFGLPITYSDQLRRRLVQLCEKRVDFLFSQIFCLGLNLFIKKEISEFIVIDYGYKKTTVGYFKYYKETQDSISKNSLVLEEVLEIPIGSINLDNVIINYILESIKITNPDKYTLTIIKNNINKIKEQLNNSDIFSINLEIKNELFTIKFDKSEINLLIEELIKEIKNKIDNFLENKNCPIEVTGGNSFFYCIKNSIDFECTRNLNYYESVSYGCCYAALLTFNKKINLYDRILGQYYLKDEEKEYLLFEDPLYLSESVFKGKDGTYELFFRNPLLINNSTDNCVGKVSITGECIFLINKKGLIESSNLEITNLFSDSELQLIKEEDLSFTKQENLIEEIKSRKVKLENMLVNLTNPNKLDPLFNLNKLKLQSIKDNLLYLEMPNTLEEVLDLELLIEKELKEEYSKLIEFNCKINEKISNFKDKLSNLKDKTYLKAIYKLMAELNRKYEELSFYNFETYDYDRIMRIEMLFKEAERELLNYINENKIKEATSSRPETSNSETTTNSESNSSKTKDEEDKETKKYEECNNDDTVTKCNGSECKDSECKSSECNSKNKNEVN